MEYPTENAVMSSSLYNVSYPYSAALAGYASGDN